MNNEEMFIAGMVNTAWTTGEANKDNDLGVYEEAIDLFNNTGSDRDYEWQSDISLPEFSTQQLTQTALDVAQYFQTRDFIETYIQDPSDEALRAADAAEECINRTLNRRDLYHYQKFVRAKSLSNMVGEVLAECWWDTETGFDYDIVLPENFVYSSEYAYSLQHKRWVVLRGVSDLEEIKANESRCSYFNIDKLEEIVGVNETQTKRASEKITGQRSNNPDIGLPTEFDVYKYFGKYWVADGGIGVDSNGKPLPDAKYEEVVITVAKAGTNSILIGYHKQPYETAQGKKIRPIIRGKCYVHPVEDHGLGDARFSAPLARAIDDTFNVSADRTMLSTLPTMKVKIDSYENEDDVYIAPGGKIPVNEPSDIEEFRFSDNTNSALAQMSTLIGMMQQANSIYPTTMGAGPERISETATAVATGERHSNQRTNYKTTTFEYTFLNELYFMILNMTWDLATPQQGFELMGDKLQDFNPSLDYFYKPLSQSVETEYSKNTKIKNYITILGYLSSMPQPKVELLNYILANIFVLMGDEYENMTAAMLQQGDVPTEPESQQGTPPDLTGVQSGSPSNQNGIPMSESEAMVRSV